MLAFVSVLSARDEAIHDMASMVTVLDMGLLALSKRPPRAEQDTIIRECREAIERLRGDFERFRALCRADP